MNATKRKFNALLQGIGTRSGTTVSATTDKNGANPSTSTLAGTSASSAGPSRDGTASDMLFAAPPLSSSSLDVLNKRRRIGLGASPHGLKDAPGSTTGGTLSNVVLRKLSGNGAAADTNAPPPRYCPNDRDQLLKRLATFQELTDWTPKPDRVNEIEWAKRGWVCQGKECLRCTLCNKEIVVKLNRKEVDGKEFTVLVASEIEAALVDKYVELMTSAHQDDCLWCKKGSDDSLLRLPLANPQTALEGLRQRYDELCTRKDFLPYEFNLRLPDGVDMDAILKNLPPAFFTNPPPAVLTSSSSPNRTALALALMGWQGLTNHRIGPVPNSASCHSCLRRLGLWMFKSKQVDPDTNTILVPAPMDHLDPAREHRFFCPWNNGAVQRNPGGGTPKRARLRGPAAVVAEDKPAWAVLVQVLKNDAYLRLRNTTASTTSRFDSRPPLSAPAAVTETPGRPPTAGAESLYGADGGDLDDEGADEAAREAKDKERWARLRKVKSLFDTKGGRKLKRPLSRPGTGHSVRPGTGHSARPDTAGSSRAAA